MKKSQLLNQPLSAIIAGLGHQDEIVIADAGLPVPPTTQRIDLAKNPTATTLLGDNDVREKHHQYV